MSTKKEEVCQNSLEFVKGVLNGDKNCSIAKFEENLDKFDFNKEVNNNLWNLLIIKASEQDAKFSPLVAHIIDKNVINLMQEVTNLASLNMVHLTLAKKSLKDTQDSINKNMEDFFFDEKVVIKNDAIDELVSWNNKLLKNSSLENLKEAKEFLVKSNLETFEGLITPLIEEKEKVSKPKIRL